jgi:hypothetical protein
VSQSDVESNFEISDDEGATLSPIEMEHILGINRQGFQEAAGYKKNDQEEGADPADQRQETNNDPEPSATHDRSGSKRPASRDGIRGERDDCHENGDGDDQKPKKRRRQLDDEEDDYSKRFACPFYKHNPQKYGNRTCVGPGWISVSRVKFVIFLPPYSHGRSLTGFYREHIYRRHSLPAFQCNRCFEDFPDESPLQDHNRQISQCVARAPEEKPEGISRSQADMLKKRGRKSATGPERWREIYRIIFPTEHGIPSPCKKPRRCLLPNITIDRTCLQIMMRKQTNWHGLILLMSSDSNDFSQKSFPDALGKKLLASSQRKLDKWMPH